MTGPFFAPPQGGDGAPASPAEARAARLAALQAAPPPHEDGTLFTAIPFSGALGMRSHLAEGGAALFSLPYNAALTGGEADGVLHGGVVTTLLDTAAGGAAMTSAFRPLSVATLDLRIDYMRPATPGAPLYGLAESFRDTAQVCFVRAIAFQPGVTDAVATAIGAFMIETKPAKAPPTGAAEQTPPADDA